MTLENIIPNYNEENFDVKNTRMAIKALDAYVCNRINDIDISVFVPKFSRLIKAIKSIPQKNSKNLQVLQKEFPQIKGHLALLEHCIKLYSKILSGKMQATEALFPDGSFDLVTQVYTSNAIADHFNAVVAKIVKNFLEVSNKTVKILEIGAGTGGTTRFVLPEIEAFNVSYNFTDISLSFLNKAKKEFSNYKFIEYNIFDVSCENNESLINDKYDIIIATNVIHATPNLNASLKNICNRLQENGIFILNEITTIQNFATVVFGLTDGWWLYNDAYRIENSPLVTGDNWKKLINSSGMSFIGKYGSDDQQVMVATKTVVDAKEKGSIMKSKLLIKSVISKVMMMSESDIDDDVPFQEYGIDSIISLELIKPLKEIYGYLPATLLFEYPTVNALSDYLDINFKNISIPQATEPSLVANSVKANFPTESNTKNFVKSIISKVMMMSESDIDDDVPFQEYGIDSIISLELIKPLKEIYGYLPATLLFEYPTINTLSDYLDKNCEIENSSSFPIVNKEYSVDSKSDFKDEDIAIIGMACNFPKAKSPEDFANNLMLGLDCTSDIPSDRWSLNGFLKADSPLNGGSYTIKGAFIDDVYSFDNTFFNLSPNEAIKMDPQERLFLQNSFHLIQDAGYSLDDLKGTNTGVYVGVMNSSYCLFTPSAEENLTPTSLRWSIANRISYIFDLHGPSMAIDTACSSSLSALHLACQALKSGDCEQAIVGGVNLIIHPKQYEALCTLYMLSRTGVCKPFGQEADGFVDGEGIGSIFLKRYKDALKDNDRIYAVIRGSFVNANGKTNGYIAPSVRAQASLIAKTLEIANLNKNEIGYIETHGTGTELGDPIEIKGLSSVFSGVERKIAIGSVKSNIGHLESAAGISGLIKVLLQMQKNVFFPSLHADKENPHIKFEGTPFYINKTLKQCSEDEIKNAGISSFGAGGANAHVILSKFIADSTFFQEEKFYFIAISAKTQNTLQKQLDTLREWLTKNYVDIYSLAYTLNCTRDHFKFRRIFVVKDQDELVELLKTDLEAPVRHSQHKLSENFSEVIEKYESGININWREIYRHRSIISIPGYEFEKNYFRINSVGYPLPNDAEIIMQHNINGKCIAPAALVISKIFDHFQKEELCVSNLKWFKTISTFDQVKVDVENSAAVQKIRFISKNLNELLCEAEYKQKNVISNELRKDIIDYRFIIGNAIYDFFKNMKYLYGKDMKSLQWAKISKNLAKGFLIADKNWGYSISPALLDGGLQLAILLFDESENAEYNFVPISIEECYIKSFNSNEAIYCYCIPRNNLDIKTYSIVCDFYYVNSKGDILIKLQGVKSIRLKKSLNNKEINKKSNVLHFD